ncbi:TIGR01777 family protein [Stutzerimonas nosocomialis]|uniref:TIGR01777 family protein n=1 Tax=Stutzerimonas nosocomialis TaxID=1056496 RepID=A0A5R9QAN3_9GAMM|nr:TIGR01777 family oxidoreductase [Stutzerimonas nosocomialis]TLX61803.1 TIGR01777 family protein [Stutzerimonas nosocomialis]
MHLLLTGGTGLIGRALCAHWQAQGHRLTVWSRRPEEVARRCGTQVRGIGQLQALDSEPLDAVVNLAGAPIADRPWTEKRRQLLWQSRVTLSDTLVDWLATREQRPAVLISGSAVGWYGDGGDLQLTEQAQPLTDDFASRLCRAWEDSASRAEALGIRVVRVRTGLVLAREGGFLQRLLPPFRLGLGGRLGNGQQWMPWIHLHDQVALIDFLLHHPQARGPFNACAPQPVRNQTFTRSLATQLRRPAVFAVPAFALKLALGELSGLLLGGQRAVPARLQAEGFGFRFETLDQALADLLR